MRITHTLAVFALTIGLAPAALAQPQPPRMEASEREIAYGKRLARTLQRTGPGAGTVKPVRVQADDVPDSVTPPPPTGSGIEVYLNDLDVTRLKFDSPEAAQEHVALLRGEIDNPLVAELRGDQVVVARGLALKDPNVARRVRQSSWHGLPAPDSTDALLTHLGDGNVALTTRLTKGPLRSFIDGANWSVQERVRRKIEGARAPDETQGAFDAPDGGRRVRVRSDRDGGSFWSATDSESAQLVQDHFFDAQGGHPEPVHAARGAREVLDDLLKPNR